MAEEEEAPVFSSEGLLALGVADLALPLLTVFFLAAVPEAEEPAALLTLLFVMVVVEDEDGPAAADVSMCG